MSTLCRCKCFANMEKAFAYFKKPPTPPGKLQQHFCLLTSEDVLQGMALDIQHLFKTITR